MPTTEVKHTPGPWVAKNWGVFNDVKSICYTATNKSGRTEEARANARLIAAAPELLAACKALIRWQDGPVIPYGAPAEAKRLALKAIARAEGQS